GQLIERYAMHLVDDGFSQIVTSRAVAPFDRRLHEMTLSSPGLRVVIATQQLPHLHAHELMTDVVASEQHCPPDTCCADPSRSHGAIGCAAPLCPHTIMTMKRFTEPSHAQEIIDSGRIGSPRAPCIGLCSEGASAAITTIGAGRSPWRGGPVDRRWPPSCRER